MRKGQSGRKEVDGGFLVTRLGLLLTKVNEWTGQSHIFETSTEHDGRSFMVECVCEISFAPQFLSAKGQEMGRVGSGRDFGWRSPI